jgi:hypothetical protein
MFHPLVINKNNQKWKKIVNFGFLERKEQTDQTCKKSNP